MFNSKHEADCKDKARDQADECTGSAGALPEQPAEKNRHHRWTKVGHELLKIFYDRVELLDVRRPKCRDGDDCDPGHTAGEDLLLAGHARLQLVDQIHGDQRLGGVENRG